MGAPTTTARWVAAKIVLPIVVACLALATFFAIVFTRGDEGSGVSLEVQGIKISYRSAAVLQVPTENLADLDEDEYYVNTELGFAYKQPEGTGWSAPATYTVLADYLRAKGIEFSDELAEPEPPPEDQNGSFVSMVQNPTIVRFASENVVTIEFTPESEAVTPQGTIDLSTSALERADIASDFVVAVYDKSRLNEQEELALPTFFTMLSSFDPTFLTNRLEAKEGIILSSAFLRYNNVMVEGEESDLASDRALLFTENDDSFFVVEASYSPETGDSLERWDRLRSVIESFRISQD